MAGYTTVLHLLRKIVMHVRKTAIFPHHHAMFLASHNFVPRLHFTKYSTLVCETRHGKSKNHLPHPLHHDCLLCFVKRYTVNMA